MAPTAPLCANGLRVSDGLIDDVVAWWTEYQRRPVPTPDDWDYAHRELEDALWRRLRAEVPSDVFVCPADFAPRPVVVEMFVDDMTGIGLWPGTVGWPPRDSFCVETPSDERGSEGPNRCVGRGVHRVDKRSI